MAYIVPQPASTLATLPFQPLGGQPAFTPEDLEAFVAGRRVAVLAYLRHDGRPHQSPIWYTHRDGVFIMTTVTGSPKHRALTRDSRVSLTIQDERPPYRAVILEGTVDLTPRDANNDPTSGMAIRYFGRVGAAEYDRLTAETYESNGLTLITMRAVAVRGFDNTHALSRTALAFVRLREHLPLPRRWL